VRRSQALVGFPAPLGAGTSIQATVSHDDSERGVRATGGPPVAGRSAISPRLLGALLVVAAAAPFVPGVCEFLHRGIPDVLFTGDGAVTEIRTLHAAHGSQLVGPYSRFHWSHPGPAFFYLALPFYEAFHRRGPALNLFAFVSNLASAIALVHSARALRGARFALVVAALLALYEAVEAPFSLSQEWNPVVPILPLGLLTVLSARLALRELAVLPAFAFVASAIVETHIGFLPVVAWLSVAPIASSVVRRFGRGHPPDSRRRPLGPTVAATGVVLLVLWSLPLLDCALHWPGNLGDLAAFFTAPHRSEHSLREVSETVGRQLSWTPAAIVQELGLCREPGLALRAALALAEVAGLVAASVAGLRGRDRPLSALSALALGEVAVAMVAVYSIRGGIYPHLVTWISMVGILGLAAMAAWLLPPAPPRRGPGSAGARAGAAILALAAIGYGVRAQIGRGVVRPPEADAERFVHGVHAYLVSAGVREPLVRAATNDVWPTFAAVVLDLYRSGARLFVAPEWLFLVGRQFAADGRPHPTLWIGDLAFCDAASLRPGTTPVVAVGSTCALLRDPE
jgi:hypothetical protein